MFNLLNHALQMEKNHRPHRDPKILESDANYKKYRPLGLCVAMREKYSDLVIINQWSALAASIPASNFGAATTAMKKDPISM